MAADFHTHRRDCPPRALVSIPFDRVAAVPRPETASLELHPWFWHSANLPESFARHAGNFDAIGEVGLDRLRGAELAVQLELLRKIFDLARQLRKPLVLHCVRASAELLTLASDYPDVRKLWHGFRGGDEGLLRRLDAAGFWISFDRRALENDGVIRYLRSNWQKNIGFESDNAAIAAGAVMAEAAAKIAVAYDELERSCDRSFDRFLSGEAK